MRAFISGIGSLSLLVHLAAWSESSGPSQENKTGIIECASDCCRNSKRRKFGIVYLTREPSLSMIFVAHPVCIGIRFGALVFFEIEPVRRFERGARREALSISSVARLKEKCP